MADEPKPDGHEDDTNDGPESKRPAPRASKREGGETPAVQAAQQPPGTGTTGTLQPPTQPRRPRTWTPREAGCVGPPPLAAPGETSVRQALTTSIDPASETWVSMSGGSFQAALGSLGVLWYLEHIGHYDSVTRQISVSGGSLANGALLNAPNHSLRDILPMVYRSMNLLPQWTRFPVYLGAGAIVIASLLLSWLVTMALSNVSAVLAAILFIPVLIIAIAAGLYLVQVVNRAWHRWQFQRVVGGDTSRTIESFPASDRRRLSVFSKTNFRSGMPMYVATGPDRNDAGTRDTVTLHDVSRATNRTSVLGGGATSLLDTVYNSSSLPGLMVLGRMFAGKREDIEPSVPVVPDAYYGSIPNETVGEDGLVPFFVGDGGLKSTLNSRIDPALQGLTAEHGTSILLDELFPAASRMDPVTELPVTSDKVRRIVIDGGQYLRRTGLARLAAVPGIGAPIAIYLGINIANLSLVEADRQQADRPGIDIWYLQVSGGGRTFRLRFTLPAKAILDAAEYDTSPNDTVVLETFGPTWNPAPNAPQQAVDGLKLSIRKVVQLKAENDKVSATSGVRDFGLDAVLSGVAAAFVEHRGLDIDPVPLELVLKRAFKDFRRGSVHPMVPLAAAAPVLVSHRGVRTPQAADNSLAAFDAALQAGYRILEVDVKLNAAGELVATHDDPNVPGLDRLEDLLTSPLLEASAGGPDFLKWNVEAKDKASAAKVGELVARLGRGDVLFSGGWKRSALRAFRDQAPLNPTACSLVEALQLVLPLLRPAQPMVAQLPEKWYLPKWFMKWVARRMHKKGVRVYYFDVETKEEAEELWAGGHAFGYMADGTDPLDWLNDQWPANEPLQGHGTSIVVGV